MSAPSMEMSSLELLCAYRQSPSTLVRNAVVRKNMGLVHKIAHQIGSQCREPYEDLAQVGAIGLIRAIERFEPSRGNSFSSFAMPYIRGEIQHYLRDRGHVVRLPRRWMELDCKGRRLIQELTQSQGHAPSEQHIADLLEISVAEWHEVRLARSNRTAISLDAPVGNTEESSSLGEMIADQPYQSFCLAEEDRIRVRQALSQLEETTRDIIESVFFQDLTQTETAQRMGLSPMTVSRRIKKGVRQMWLLLNTKL
jgi:RNA polymerase sigma-B factor